jgi:hypothetical protein
MNNISPMDANPYQHVYVALICFLASILHMGAPLAVKPF